MLLTLSHCNAVAFAVEEITHLIRNSLVHIITRQLVIVTIVNSRYSLL